MIREALQQGEIGSVIRMQGVVLSCEQRTASNGDYLVLTLSDGQSEIEAKWWQFTGKVPSNKKVYHVVGIVAEYRGSREMHVRRMNEMDVSIDRYLPAGPRKPEDLFEEAMELISGIRNENLQAACRNLYESSREIILKAPAARKIHHNYTGGLLEHSIEVTTAALMVGQGCDRDVLVAGGLLHDIGKVSSYRWDGVEIVETNGGRLIGHIPIGISMWIDAAVESQVDLDYVDRVGHIISSHHGRLEWGSPVLPATIEAMIIHQCDIISSQKAIWMKSTEGIEGWTERIFPLGRRLYR